MNRYLCSLFGLFSGLLLPLAALMANAYSDRHQWWNSWLKKEWDQHFSLYIVLTVMGILVFSFVGYLWGAWIDKLYLQAHKTKHANRNLNQLAITDQLTGLFNLRHIHERLDIELKNSFKSPLTCALVDIDHFKKINDTYGHPFGDEVLKRVAQILKRTVRKVDIVGRMGGEEFIVILPNTSKEGAQIITERLRAAVEAEIFEFETTPLHVTISLGVMSFIPHKHISKETLLKTIDQGLYSAKEQGRNRIVFKDPDTPGPKSPLV